MTNDTEKHFPLLISPLPSSFRLCRRQTTTHTMTNTHAVFFSHQLDHPLWFWPLLCIKVVFICFHLPCLALRWPSSNLSPLVNVNIICWIHHLPSNAEVSHKDILLTTLLYKNSQQILTFEKLELVNLGHFCLKKLHTCPINYQSCF